MMAGLVPTRSTTSASGMRLALSCRVGLNLSSGQRPLSGSAKTTSQSASRVLARSNHCFRHPARRRTGVRRTFRSSPAKTAVPRTPDSSTAFTLRSPARTSLRRARNSSGSRCCQFSGSSRYCVCSPSPLRPAFGGAGTGMEVRLRPSASRRRWRAASRTLRSRRCPLRRRLALDQVFQNPGPPPGAGGRPGPKPAVNPSSGLPMRGVRCGCR